MKSATTTTNERKRKWISENVGDCCSLCGYNKCKRALELHHIIETNYVKGRKNTKNNRGGLGSMSWQDIYDDAPYMVVLCSNCHKEVHDDMHPEVPVPKHTTSGERQQGRPPYGYKWQDGEIVKNIETYPYRERMLELHKQGLGWSAISRKLNEEELPTQTGKSKWFPTTVMRIINPRYTKRHQTND
jgi:hypothetical protein